MFKNEKGYALVLVLIIMIILFMLGTVLIMVSTTQVREAVKQQERVQAYYLAYSGAKAVAEWVMDPENDEQPSGTSAPMDMGAGSFIVHVVESVNGDTLTITSHGTVDGYTETVVVTLTKTISETNHGNHPAFDYALFSKSGINTPSGAYIDGSIYGEVVNLLSADLYMTGSVVSETDVSYRGNSGTTIEKNIYAPYGEVFVADPGGTATVEGSVNASGNVYVGSSGKVEGDIYSGSNVILKPSSSVVLGSIHALNDVTLGSGSTAVTNVYAGRDVKLLNTNSRVLGNVYAGNNINLDGSTFIDGVSYAGGSTNNHNPDSVNQAYPPLIQPVQPSYSITELVQPPELSSFTHGVDDKILLLNWQQAGPQQVPPGAYNNIVLNWNNTLRLSSGNYYINNFNTNNPSGLKLQLDLSNGPINVYATGNIRYCGQVWVSEDGVSWTQIHDLDQETAVRLAGMVYWETHGNFELSSASGGANNRQWFGTVLAKNNITTASAFRMIGAYATVEGAFSMEANPIIIYAPPTSSAAGGSEGNGSGGENGSNNGVFDWGNPKWSSDEL